MKTVVTLAFVQEGFPMGMRQGAKWNSLFANMPSHKTPEMSKALKRRFRFGQEVWSENNFIINEGVLSFNSSCSELPVPLGVGSSQGFPRAGSMRQRARSVNKALCGPA